jgi:dihydroorotate dehydrogenase
MYESLLRPLLFRLDPEHAHALAFRALAGIGSLPPVVRGLRRRAGGDGRRRLEMQVAGLTFPNPVGLAAGLDKDAEAIAGLFALGFGSLEVGTVTPRPQPGNDPPRLFRLAEHGALINRMGFNNRGVEAMAQRLARARFRPGPIGVNIGKNRDTPLDRAVEDYVACARVVSRWADYVAVNLSSPNTPGLRTLQEPRVLEQLLTAVRAQVNGRPVFLKIAPDLSDEGIDAAVDVARSTSIDGLICANTTLGRPFEHPLAKEAGGLSGRPLAARSTEVVRRAFRRAHGHLPIIGVGGIFDGDDAWEKIGAGASLVQLFTGFIYRGPSLVRSILDALEAKLEQAGLDVLADAVGRNA